MKTVVQVLFGTYKLPGGAQDVLGPAGCGPDVAKVDEKPVLRTIDVSVTLEETDPRVHVLFQLLKQYNTSWQEFHEDVYTEEELDRARLLLVMGNRQCEIDGGVMFGTTYDTSGACPLCWTGAKQNSPLFVNGDDLDKLEDHRAGETYCGHLFVDEGLAKEIERLGARGLALCDMVAAWKNGRTRKLPWKQISAARTLPRMTRSTIGFARNQPCDRCYRNGYFPTREEPTRVVYRASDLGDVDDVSFSWENYGFAALETDFRESLLSQPWLLVTPKVRRVFRDAGVTCFDWIPVRVEEG